MRHILQIHTVLSTNLTLKTFLNEEHGQIKKSSLCINVCPNFDEQYTEQSHWLAYILVDISKRVKNMWTETFYMFYMNAWIDGYSIDWLTNIWRDSYFNNWPHNTYMEWWLFHWLTNIWREGYSIGWNRAFGGVSATTCWVFFTEDPSRTTSCVASSTAAASVGGASISSTGTEILILSSCFKNMSGWICIKYWKICSVNDFKKKIQL